MLISPAFIDAHRFMHIFDADSFMHVLDILIFLHILDAVILVHISHAVTFILSYIRALMGWALMGPPWALIGQALMGRALVGPPGPSGQGAGL